MEGANTTCEDEGARTNLHWTWIWSQEVKNTSHCWLEIKPAAVPGLAATDELVAWGHKLRLMTGVSSQPDKTLDSESESEHGDVALVWAMRSETGSLGIDDPGYDEKSDWERRRERGIILFSATFFGNIAASNRAPVLPWWVMFFWVCGARPSLGRGLEVAGKSWNCTPTQLK